MKSWTTKAITICTSIIVIAAMACAASDQPTDQASELHLEPQVTPATNQQAPSPTPAPTQPSDDPTVQPTDSTPPTKEILPTPVLPTAQNQEEPTPTPAVRPTYGDVYVAPKVEAPTETPKPEPTPTVPLDGKPATRWDQFTEAEYLAILPDPALGVTWGTKEIHCGASKDVHTPPGIAEKYPEQYMDIYPSEVIADVSKSVNPLIENGLPGHGMPGLKYRARHVCNQGFLLHPEIPVTSYIHEFEVAVIGQDGHTAWQNWRTGQHYIIKDSYQQRGQNWQLVLELQKIGPTIVEQIDCQSKFTSFGECPSK